MCVLRGCAQQTNSNFRFVRESASWLSNMQGDHSSRLIPLFPSQSFAFDFAEAMTCRAAIRGARAVVKDIGEKAAESSKGLLNLSKCTHSHSERDFHSLANQFQLALPIPLTTINKTRGVRYTGDFSVLALCDWCKFHLDFNTWHILAGLSKPDETRECAIFSEFWRRYRLLKPAHQMWKLVDEHSIDLGRTAPLILHGDEGRGRKRAAFLVLAYHSYLGKGTDLANLSRKHRPYKTMRLNYSGNSHTHRMLSAVLPKMVRDSIAFKDIIKFVTDDSLKILKDGVRGPGGNIYRMAVVQVVGDWMFLQKVANLERSYANVEKRPRNENSRPRGICHCCKAGQLEVPFEDTRPTAAWRRTLFAEDDQPFSSRPTLLDLPHEPHKAPDFFTYDLWHAFHLGLGKTFTASVLAMMSEQIGASNIEARFSQLSAAFLDFCDEFHESSYITSISKDTLGWPDTKTFPNGQWNKGHVTTLLCKFIAHWFHVNGTAGDPLFPMAAEAVIAINSFMHGLYTSDVWIDAADAKRLSRLGRSFLILYMQLARRAYDANRNLFIFMPKLHAFDHCVHKMEMESSQHCYTLNPLNHAVQIDEDFVGRISRTSRRTGVGQVITRVLQRALESARWHYVQEGYIRG